MSTGSWLFHQDYLTAQAFASAQELGAWTMGLLWTEVMNRIERVRASTECDDKEKKKNMGKVNIKGYKALPQAMFMQNYKPYKPSAVGKN
eukprot:5227867-Amphidinium_carterae.4